MGEQLSSHHHISSAVVAALPDRSDEVVRNLAALPDTEVHFVQNGKIVIVLEGRSVDVIGSRLTAIASMNGVLAASLVFEQVEPLGDPEGAP